MGITPKTKKILVEISRIVIGIVFIFSGFVKVVDPWGYTYKILDYLQAFGMDFFNALAFPAAVFISGLELVIGVCILIGIYKRFFSILLLMFMCFMTPLTLYLAIANPVHDCGCFGDALVISNWQTFWKNIVLLLMAIAIFLWHKQMKSFFLSKKRWGAVVFASVFAVGLSAYCYLYLPILDFRPYKIGNNLIDLREIPDGAPIDEYEITNIYVKDGIEKEFQSGEYPDSDEWTWVRRGKEELIKEGYKPALEDFVMVDDYGDDMTDDILYDEQYTFLMVAWDLEKASDSHCSDINDIYEFCLEQEYNFFGLTSSNEESISKWKEKTGAEYSFLSMDPIELKTIVRANPGLVLLKNGVVLNKWSARNIPVEKLTFLPLEVSEWGKLDTKYIPKQIKLFSKAISLPSMHDFLAVVIPFFILALGLYVIYLIDVNRQKKWIKEKKKEKAERNKQKG
jgi:Predicted membrane protein